MKRWLQRMAMRIALSQKPVETCDRMILKILENIFDQREADRWMQHIQQKRKEQNAGK